MKTAMQQLFDELKESVKDERFVVNNPKAYHPNDVKQANLIISCVYNVLTKIEPLLKVEKQQIIDAYDEGKYLSCGKNFNGETYYNNLK